MLLTLLFPFHCSRLTPRPPGNKPGAASGFAAVVHVISVSAAAPTTQGRPCVLTRTPPALSPKPFPRMVIVCPPAVLPWLCETLATAGWMTSMYGSESASLNCALYWLPYGRGYRAVGWVWALP